MPLTNKVGAILMGERIALGRGRLLELLTVETICTGPPFLLLPPPPPLLPPPLWLWASVSIASSSEPLDTSLPDPLSLLLDDDDDVDEVEELRPSLARPLLSPGSESGIREGIRGGGGGLDEEEEAEGEALIVVTWTLPMLETRRVEEDCEEEVVEGGGGG